MTLVCHSFIVAVVVARPEVLVEVSVMSRALIMKETYFILMARPGIRILSLPMIRFVPSATGMIGVVVAVAVILRIPGVALSSIVAWS